MALQGAGTPLGRPLTAPSPTPSCAQLHRHPTAPAFCGVYDTHGLSHTCCAFSFLGCLWHTGGGIDTAPTQDRWTGTFTEVYDGPTVSSIPFYITASYADWQGNVTAERALTEGPTGRWQFPNLWNAFTFTASPDDITVQMIFVDTVTLTGDMLNNPVPAPPGITASPPPPAAAKSSSDSSAGEALGGTGTDTVSQSLSAVGGASAAESAAAYGVAGHRRRAHGFGGGASARRRGGGHRSLHDFNRIHNPPVSIPQWDWFEHVVNTSSADWLIVVGSDPIWSAGEHGPTWGLVDSMMPLLAQHGAALYISGRDPLLQHISEVPGASGLDYVGSGVGSYFNITQGTTLPGASLCPPGTVQWTYSNSTGFLTVTLSGLATVEEPMGTLTVTFYDAGGNKLYSFTKTNQRTPPHPYGLNPTKTGKPQKALNHGAAKLSLVLVCVAGGGILYFVYLAMCKKSKSKSKSRRGEREGSRRERAPLLGSPPQPPTHPSGVPTVL